MSLCLVIGYGLSYMENLVDNVIRLNFSEIESFNFPLDDVFGLEINYDGIKYCFIIRLSSKNKNLICCGSGAQQRNGKVDNGKLKRPPYLDRWSWYKFFEESFIVYADPIFFYDDKIRLGWYVGDKNQWYIEIIASIIEKILFNQNIALNNTMFYGSSGGGFASICLGTLLKGSKVLVNNPQFNVMNYYKGFVNDLFRILKKEFQELSESELKNKLKYRLNTIDLFKKENYIPPITYYINTESEVDLNRHCIPFINDIKELSCFNDELVVCFYKEERESPHSPMFPKESQRVIKLFAKQNLYNDD